MGGRSIDSYSLAGKIGLGALCMVFVLLGTVIARSGSYEIGMAKASSNWPQTTGLITKSGIAEDDDSSPHTWQPQVVYAYSVNGRALEGSQIAFGYCGSASISEAQDVASRYPVGGEVRVYYNSEDPTWCVLLPGAQCETYGLPVFGFTFIFMGLACVGAVVRSILVSMRPRWQSV